MFSNLFTYSYRDTRERDTVEKEIIQVRSRSFLSHLAKERTGFKGVGGGGLGRVD